MYAIVDIAGQQFKAETGKRLYVNRLQAEQGSVVEFDKVLLIDTDGKVEVGEPTVKGAKIVCEVLSHPRDKKVLIFKKKRRTGYRKLNGHRQDLTELKINEIVVA